MKFSTREDIEAPIEAAFEGICAFERFERAAMRRGAEVRRVDTMTEPGVGMTWQALVELRGKTHDLTVEMSRFERPVEMTLACRSARLTGTTHIELVALSRHRTRIMASLELRPRNLSGRVIIQSLKLVKSSLNEKFARRVAEFAETVERDAGPV